MPPPFIDIVEGAQCVDRSDRGVHNRKHPGIHHPVPRPEPSSINSRPLNLKTPSRWTMETPEISESTPLLCSPSVPRPCIRPVIDRLLAQSNTTPTAEHILAQLPPRRDLIPSYRTAFVLITLLQIGGDAREQLTRDDSLNLWDAWDHHVNAELVAEHCASHALEVWSNFLRVPRDNADLDSLIWTAFPLKEDGCTSVCRMFFHLDFDPQRNSALVLSCRFTLPKLWRRVIGTPAHYLHRLTDLEIRSGGIPTPECQLFLSFVL